MKHVDYSTGSNRRTTARGKKMSGGIKPFRGLPPLRGGSGTSSYKGGTGNVPRSPQLKRKNFLLASFLLAFAGTIYITALRKLSGVYKSRIYFLILSLGC